MSNVHDLAVPARRSRRLAADVLASLALTLVAALALMVVIVLRLGEEVHLTRELTRLKLEVAQLTDPTVRERVVPAASALDWAKLVFGVRDQDGFLLISPEGRTMSRGRPAEGEEWLARARAASRARTTSVETVRAGPFRRPVRLIASAAVPVDGALHGLIVTREMEGPVAPGGGEILGIYVVLFTVVPVGFGYVLLARLVVRPIQRLVAFTDRIRAGELKARLGVVAGGGNEIDQLGRSLNAMSAQLEHEQEVSTAQLAALEAMNRELSRAQEERVRVEKLATIGRLSAGVAHEIGNPLGAIQGFVELLLAPGGHSVERGLSGDEEQDLLRRIDREARRIRGIVEGLLRFSRTPPGPGRPSLPDRVIEETLDLLAGQGSLQGFSVERRLGVARVSAAIDPQALQQVLINLFSNALGAMPAGGHLSVSSRALDGPEPTSGVDRGDPWRVVLSPTGPLGVEAADAGNPWVRITIGDTGGGIRPEDVGRVFEPFFTTKDVGKGTGLGLAIVLGTIENVGGGVRIRTSSAGTEVQIDLPPGPLQESELR